MEGRIWFPGNPWPAGHRVEAFDWTGRLDDAGRLWFDLTLETAFYYAETDDDEEEDEEADDRPDWEAPSVWGNYHRCTMSSTYWDDAAGLLAATPEHPLRLAGPDPSRLTADLPPVERSAAIPALRIYLLGHDSVAGHTITFTADGPGTHSIDWRGRIALTYIGDESFRHEFRAEIRGAALTRISRPAEMATDEAARRVAHLLGLPEDQTAALVTQP